MAKPVFGTKAVTQEPKEQATTDDTPKVSSVEEPQAAAENKPETPRFGTAASVADETEKPRVGAHAEEQAKKSRVELLLDVFKLQPTSFWVKNYLFSLVGLLLFANLGTLGWVNFVFYPITVTILREIGQQFHHHPGWLGGIVLGTAAISENASIVMILVYWLARLIFFVLKFMFSFIIGPIGLIYMLSQAKKMNL